MKNFLRVIGLLILLSGGTSALAEESLGLTTEQQEGLNDIAISVNEVNNPEDVLVGKTVRIYATVVNNAASDQKGVVRFFNEKTGRYISTDQPFSAVAGGTDTVFIDILADSMGENPIAMRVIPDDESGDNPDNNKITDVVYVDQDADGDGDGNRRDTDDDNDGVPDADDALPFNPSEFADTDGDSIGNNADADDDGDGVSDVEDTFPLDGAEVADADGDGMGDNADAFPADPSESADADNDGVGANADTNDANHGPIASIHVGRGGGTRGSGGSSEIQDDGSASSGSDSASASVGASGGSVARNTGGSGGGGSSLARLPGEAAESGETDAKPSGGGNGSQPPSGASDSERDDVTKVYTGQSVTFNALQSRDPDGEITDTEWDFGDGQIYKNKVMDYRFKKAGTYRVALRVTDNQGETREETVKVVVRSRWKVVLWPLLTAAALVIGVKRYVKNRKKNPLSKKKK